jgi:predicted nucleic acid-binding protein
MRVYFDTSAVIPLVLAEKHTEAVRSAWPNISDRWAWSWLVVEAEAALVRQKADADAWTEWSRVLRSLNLVELNPSDHGALRAFNRGLGLRAVDAGHLFLFDRLSREVDGLQLLTFDREMSQAAKYLAMPLHAV